MLVDRDRTCDRCESNGPLSQVDPPGWNYCATCKADWTGYKEGRRDQALTQLGHAIDMLLEENFTHYEIRKAVQLRLVQNFAQGDREPLDDAFREVA
jgi:hypothetical protein